MNATNKKSVSNLCSRTSLARTGQAKVVGMHALAASLLLLLQLNAGCGCDTSMIPPESTGTENPAEVESPAAADQKEALTRLGVDTSPSPRVDNGGNEIPESYSPLGATRTLGQKLELYMAGRKTPAGNVATLYQDFSCLGDDPACTQAQIDGMVLATRTEADAPWLLENLSNNANPETLRATAAADVDGDGFDEIVTAYFKAPDEIRLNITDDESGGFTISDVLVGKLENVRDVSLAGGDFDGDGASELVVGLCTQTEATLWFLADQNEGFFVEDDHTKTIERLVTDSSMSLNLAAGNIDYDNAHELAVALNEIKGQCVPAAADSRQFIFDDASTDHAELESGPVQGRDQDGVLRTALVSDVALGDVDGDGLDEILLAGLTEFPGCNINDCEQRIALLLARDDAVSGFKNIGVLARDFSPGGCNVKIRFLHVNALDIDGDDRAEVQVNQFVYEDWNEAAPWTHAYSVSNNWIFGDWNDPDTYAYDKTTSAIATGDVTGDGREDIIITGFGNSNVPRIMVFGVNASNDPPTLGRVHSMRSGQESNPILVVANVDVDGTVLKSQEGSHSLEYTEPIVLAVLAAPPCIEGGGQNTDACRTTFGNSSSIGTETERSFFISASVIVGISAEDRTFTQSAIEVTASVKATVAVTTSHAYTLEKSVVRTSGPMEDSVIFMTQPLDRYLYTVISHVDPGLIGTTVDIWMPRDPIVLLAEREFYNASITEGSLKVDESIFQHEIGDPASYPTLAQKNQLILTSLGNPLLQNGPQSVGQGSGEIELSLDVSNEFSAGASLALEFEFEAKLTVAAVTVGASYGYGAEATWTLTSGSSTTYAGAVGNLDAASFQDDQYSFGLFTYRQLDPVTLQQFEVINYWVE